MIVGPGQRGSGKGGLEVGITHAACGGAQVVGGAAHLHRRIDDGADLRMADFQQCHHRFLAALDFAALVQSPEVDAHQVQHQQRQRAHARWTPRWAQQALPAFAQQA